ncbi:MAG TPA: DUF2273 domain-containing protein [Firmicutes bacterium]|nr:DUF2273 domain-containing protein [Bacillota bacterium]
MANRFRDILTRHAGKVYGSVLGLIVGWIIIRYGVLRGLFVILCVAAGFYLGARFDSADDSFKITGRF